jgi:hypothetical protein
VGGVPIILLIALWRYRGGNGALLVGIAALVFLVVHLPWSWATITGAETNPLGPGVPIQPPTVAGHAAGSPSVDQRCRMDYLVQATVSPGSTRLASRHAVPRRESSTLRY